MGHMWDKYDMEISLKILIIGQFKMEFINDSLGHNMNNKNHQYRPWNWQYQD